MSKCECVTAKNKQCLRGRKNNSPYCWQHSECKRPLKTRKVVKNKNEKKIVVGKKNNELPSKIPFTMINENTLENLLMHSDYKTVKSICLANKLSNRVCNDFSFWKKKYTHDKLPFMNKNKSITLKHHPADMSLWLKIYEDINFVKNIVEKLVTNILLGEVSSKGEYKIPSMFLIIFVDTGPKIIKDIEGKVIKLLPSTFERKYVKMGSPKRPVLENVDFEFNIKRGKDFSPRFFIKVHIVVVGDDEDTAYHETEIKKEVTKNDFIYYMTKLIYAFPDLDITARNDKRLFSYKELSSAKIIKNVKAHLPKWYV